MYRTYTCGELRAEHAGSRVTLAGWVHRVRDLGGLTFIDLRDRYGLTQLYFNPDNAELMERAARLRMEDVIQIVGTVTARPEQMRNTNMSTGDIEVQVETLEVLTRAAVLPFTLEEEDTAHEELRLKYRYLDLRRPGKARYLHLRHRLAQAARRTLDELSFLEVETPILMKSTPEGARDYLVPSRLHHGHFYALPQSPQTYKQLLMVAGFDRYYQIVKCFRDEDLRSDRQPEFTQIDLEMSFAEEKDVQDVAEAVIAACVREAWQQELELPLRRMSWQEAMERYGSDKPDLRFGMEIQDIAELVPGCNFGVLEGALPDGVTRGFVLPGQAEGFSRKKVDALQDYAKHLGGKGVIVVRYTAEGLQSQISKFVGDEWLARLAEHMGASEGDVMILAAGEFRMVCKLLGNMRLRLAGEYGMIDPKRHELLWVTEFPMFEYDEEAQRHVAAHHPFTQPNAEQFAAEVDPGALLSRGYDLVMDGQEIAGGSVRIHDPNMQRKVFSMLGIGDEEAQEKFGFLIDALQYGAPPHAGCAFGFDRLVMIFGGTENIRDVIAFPKTNSAASPMDGAPGGVSATQLAELHISVVPEKE